MPTYGYRCKSCGHQFDEWQKISDEPLVACPSCKNHSLIRVIGGGAGLIFKGTGFYQTDYKKSPASKKDSNDEKKPEKKSEPTNPTKKE